MPDKCVILSKIQATAWQQSAGATMPAEDIKKLSEIALHEHMLTACPPSQMPTNHVRDVVPVCRFSVNYMMTRGTPNPLKALHSACVSMWSKADY